MEIHIDDRKNLESIKSEFSARYPFLKIEFFNKAHESGLGSPKTDMITHDLSLGEVRTKHNEGDILIKGDMKVGDLELQFETLYGIHVQIFRKSGDLWLETSATDQWTLNEQNETGQEMS
jgi:hypothetical protein